MICIPAIAICDECEFELEQRIPLTQGMMNLISVDARQAPNGWEYRADKLLCGECKETNRPGLKMVKQLAREAADES